MIGQFFSLNHTTLDYVYRITATTPEDGTIHYDVMDSVRRVSFPSTIARTTVDGWRYNRCHSACCLTSLIDYTKHINQTDMKIAMNAITKDSKVMPELDIPEFLPAEAACSNPSLTSCYPGRS